MKFSHPLMHNNLTASDRKAAIKLLKTKNIILTQSKNVKKFEQTWSKWLGVKYSVFVNSGSSANLLTISILKILYKKNEIIVPTLAWVSDINSVIQNNFKPVFVDINPKNLCMDEDEIIKKINKKTLAVFLTHVQGFNGLSDRLLTFLKRKKILLIEDVCESYGATFKGNKLGSFGLMSNFSFYFAHHMSTIEGGMISTNDNCLYQLCRMFRSHGMVRELNDEQLKNKYIEENPELWTDDLKYEIHCTAERTVELEDAFIDLCFEGAEIEGLIPEDIKLYIRYIANRRLLGLGMKKIFGSDQHPLPWLDYMLNGVEHTNFFENRATEYSRASTTGNWQDIFK